MYHIQYIEDCQYVFQKIHLRFILLLQNTKSNTEKANMTGTHSNGDIVFVPVIAPFSISVP